MASNAPSYSSRPTTLEILMRQYVPKELFPRTWKYEKQELEQREIILNMLNLYTQGQPQLGMFESALDLLDEVGHYFSFPKGMKHFVLDHEDPFEPIPYDYKNAQQKTAVYKADLYRGFDSRGSYPFQGWSAKVAHAILVDCWKKLADETNHYDMIVYPYQPTMPSEVHVRNLPVFKNPVPKDQFDKFMDNWEKKMQPKINQMAGFILNSMMENLAMNMMYNHSVELAKIITYCGLVMESVAKFAETAAFSLPSLNKIKKAKPVIRVFSIGNYKFVMSDELARICREHYYYLGEYQEEARKLPKLSTFAFDDVAPYCRNFEHVTIEKNQLLMFAQTPIPTDTGYCIFAVDALYELLIDMIVAKKVFQDITEDNWKLIIKHIDSITDFDESKGIYFIDLVMAAFIKNCWQNVYETKLTKLTSSPKQILERRETGITVEDLEKTLESLGLETCFEDIKDYAAPLHAKLIATSAVQASALHLAVAFCQINCLVRVLPELLEFIHNQKSCDRLVIVGCEHCEEEKVVEDFSKMSTSEQKGNASKKKKNNKNKQNKNKTKRKK